MVVARNRYEELFTGVATAEKLRWKLDSPEGRAGARPACCIGLRLNATEKGLALLL